MLKNIHPSITGTLLDELRALEPGSWLAITNDARTAALAMSSIVGLDTDFEGAASAILSVLPLHTEDDAPLHFWVQNPENDQNWDAVLAVSGLVRDGERRAVASRQISARDAREAIVCAELVVHVPDVRPNAVFLLRVGGHWTDEVSMAGFFTARA